MIVSCPIQYLAHDFWTYFEHQIISRYLFYLSFLKYPMNMKYFGLAETKLFHFHGIFKTRVSFFYMIWGHTRFYQISLGRVVKICVIRYQKQQEKQSLAYLSLNYHFFKKKKIQIILKVTQRSEWNPGYHIMRLCYHVTFVCLPFAAFQHSLVNPLYIGNLF